KRCLEIETLVDSCVWRRRASFGVDDRRSRASGSAEAAIPHWRNIVHRVFRSASLVAMIALIAGAFGAMSGSFGGSAAAQGALSCTVAPKNISATPAAAATPSTPVPPSSGPLTKVTIGYVNASVFAPIFIAKERGFFAA